MEFTTEQLDIVFKESESILKKQAEVLAEHLTESYYESGLIDAIRYASRYPKEKMAIASKYLELDDDQINFICYTIQDFTYDLLLESRYNLSRYLEQETRFSMRIFSKVFLLIEDSFDSLYGTYPEYFHKNLDSINQ